MVDREAFRSLSYGLYIVSSKLDGTSMGCVVNTFAQVTSEPAQVSVAVNKDNATAGAIKATGAFEAVALDESASMEIIGTFGFHSSSDTDKFASCAHATSEQGLPYVTDGTCAHFSVKVTDSLDLGTHILFIGEVVEAESVGTEAPMAYAYYHQVKGGKTPPKASSYDPSESAPVAPSGESSPKIAWRCMLCGHIEYVDELPDDFVCPLCGAGKDMFERIEL